MQAHGIFTDVGFARKHFLKAFFRDDPEEFCNRRAPEVEVEKHAAHLGLAPKARNQIAGSRRFSAPWCRRGHRDPRPAVAPHLEHQLGPKDVETLGLLRGLARIDPVAVNVCRVRLSHRQGAPAFRDSPLAGCLLRTAPGSWFMPAYRAPVVVTLLSGPRQSGLQLFHLSVPFHRHIPTLCLTFSRTRSNGM